MIIIHHLLQLRETRQVFAILKMSRNGSFHDKLYSPKRVFKDSEPLGNALNEVWPEQEQKVKSFFFLLQSACRPEF